jgi:diguanylate cyclase (GGDEF)-like protein/PAS domain S-box-containing protein
LSDNHNNPEHATNLREQAEALLDSNGAGSTISTPEQTAKLIHELRTHQIELELQNEELRLAQQELIEARDMYSNLYDFAPVGYVTTFKGIIVEANLTMTEMLGIGRSELLQRRLSEFVAMEDQDDYYQHCQSALGSDQSYTSELRMIGDVGQFWVELDSMRVGDGGETRIRTIIINATARKQAEAALSYQATHDALTGLINRHEFERRLVRVLRTTRKLRSQNALCYLDLDQFKVINDTFGHMAGDELLRQLAQLLTRTVRKRDTLARLGGDEFGVLMEQCSLTQARRVANKLRKAVEGYRFLWENQEFRFGVSIGLVPITEMSVSVAYVLSAADSACYRAKDEGRNRVHVYQPDDADLASRKGEMQWVARIDRALAENRLQLWSQPIVPVMSDTGDYEDLEFLLRLVDEQGKIILPGVFLPAAERYGLSVKLDQWVVAAALDWLGRNRYLQERLQLCFINLSGASLADEGFLNFVKQQFIKHPVSPGKICFEITETAAIGNLSRAMTFINVLQDRGCRFALDDFGSGLSSFAYLRTLPADFIKIDGSFVRNIVDDEVDLALVRSINDVGKVMGKWTIAESVESVAILNKLREIGVDYAQGYAIGYPIRVTNSPKSLLGRPKAELDSADSVG